jgi:hypothetical protein
VLAGRSTQSPRKLLAADASGEASFCGVPEQEEKVLADACYDPIARGDGTSTCTPGHEMSICNTDRSSRFNGLCRTLRGLNKHYEPAAVKALSGKPGYVVQCCNMNFGTYSDNGVVCDPMFYRDP